MPVYMVNKSMTPKLLIGDRYTTAEDGSITIDLGYGPVAVNPKYITFLLEVRRPTKEDFSSISANQGNAAISKLIPAAYQSAALIEGKTEEQYDAAFLHALGIYAGSQAKYDPAALTDSQKELLQRVLEDDLKRNGRRDV